MSIEIAELIRPLWTLFSARFGSVVLTSFAWTAVSLAQPIDRPIEVASLVQNVVVAESLYDQVEVSLSFRYETLGNTDPIIAEQISQIMKSSGEVFFVSQDGKLAYEKHSVRNVAGVDLPENTGIISRYDGVKSRSFLKKSMVANIVDGRQERFFEFRPHMAVFAYGSVVGNSLSALLSGDEVFGSGDFTRPEIGGTDLVNDLECYKVSLRSYMNGDPEKWVSIWNLWICPERNYLPIKAEGTSSGYEIPLEEIVVSDFVELSPGVWYPKEWEILVNDNLASARGDRVPINRTVWKVAEVSLQPSRPDEFFSELEIPDGATVALIRDGKVYEQYVQGEAPAGGSAPIDQASFPWRYLIWGNVLVVLFALAVLWLRGRANGAENSTES